jgi:Leucine-rich repeat (LRR) protein
LQTLSFGSVDAFGGGGGDNSACANAVFAGVKDATKISTLSKLGLTGCTSLQSLPAWLGQLGALKELNLSNCKSLERLPDESSQLAKLNFLNVLTHLDLAGWSTVHVFEELVKCTSLQHLNLARCSSLERLPAGFGKLVNLTELNLSYCGKLTSLPAGFGKLVNLTELNLSYCGKLTSLPAGFGKLVNLTVLNLSQCSQLTSLPAGFGELANLTELNPYYCQSLAEPFPDLSHLLPALKITTYGDASDAAKAWVKRGLTAAL